MNNKEKYICDAKNRFKGKEHDLILNQIELFYDITENINKNKYNKGEYVI